VQDDHCGQSGPNVTGDAIAEKKVVEEVLGEEKGENGPTNNSNAVRKNSLEHLTLWNRLAFQHLRWKIDLASAAGNHRAVSHLGARHFG
jgi:hypothetical protein